jgi:hypothetical protein
MLLQPFAATGCRSKAAVASTDYVAKSRWDQFPWNCGNPMLGPGLSYFIAGSPSFGTGLPGRRPKKIAARH